MMHLDELPAESQWPLIDGLCISKLITAVTVVVIAGEKQDTCSRTTHKHLGQLHISADSLLNYNPLLTRVQPISMQMWVG